MVYNPEPPKNGQTKISADKAALRALAEAATQPRSACDAQFWDFHNAVTPAAVLALLDELERMREPTPRQPWDVLREAAEIIKDHAWRDAVVKSLLMLADNLEAAAAPKPPTLAEAVRAWLDFPEGTVARAVAMNAMREALARAEAEAGQ